VKKYLFAFITVLLVITAAAAYALEVPALKGRVNDYGDMISPEAEKTIDRKLEAFEASDSTQVVILTVNSLEGDAMEDFTIRVAEKWKIGQAKKDNGVILFASKNDRRMRIEVGPGLEGVLTDLLAGRILDNVIRPKFKAGDFNGGFNDGIDAIISACRGEFKNDSRSKASHDEGPSGNFITILFIGFYFLIVIISKFSKILGGAVGAAALPAFVHYAFIPLGLTGILISAVSGFILALILPYIPIGGFSVGSSGGSSSFGGFSGGGGGFGGGGSSGGW
jgi:uncharacterized protein